MRARQVRETVGSSVVAGMQAAKVKAGQEASKRKAMVDPDADVDLGFFRSKRPKAPAAAAAAAAAPPAAASAAAGMGHAALGRVASTAAAASATTAAPAAAVAAAAAARPAPAPYLPPVAAASDPSPAAAAAPIDLKAFKTAKAMLAKCGAEVRDPHTSWNITRHDGPKAPRIVMRGAPRASNRSNHLGLCALQAVKVELTRLGLKW